MSDNSYDSRSIKKFSGAKAVRRSVGMYLGQTSLPDGARMAPAAINACQEIMSNSVDEALSGFANEISVTIFSDDNGRNMITISDNGRGVPAGDDCDTAVSIFTSLHTSAKGRGHEDGAKAYKFSGGLNGVGATAAAAISQDFFVHAIDSKKVEYELHFHQGELVEKKIISKRTKKPTGTSITLTLDPEIFGEHTHIDPQTVRSRMDWISLAVPGVTLRFTSRLGDSEETYMYKREGLMDYVAEWVSEDPSDGGKTSTAFQTITGTKDLAGEDFVLDLALALGADVTPVTVSLANAIPTFDGGSHIDGIRAGLVKAVNDYATAKSLFKDKDKSKKITPADVMSSLALVVAVQVPAADLDFKGQTKEALASATVRRACETIAFDEMSKILFDDDKAAKLMMAVILANKQEREEHEQAREVSKKLKVSKSDPLARLLSGSKLTPARSRTPEEKELFIVEGDSAGGSAKKGRNSMTQAILPLKGKPMNVYEKPLATAIKNPEVASIIAALGAGVGKNFDVSQLQYHKVIIMADADNDGLHIAELLIALFYRLTPDLVKKGHLYMAQPPLYRFDRYVGGKREKAFAINREEYEAMLPKYKGWTVTRLKGLGEMNDRELKETAMDPATRRLVRVQVTDEMQLKARLQLFLGSNRAAQRREWIDSNVTFTDDEE